MSKIDDLYEAAQKAKRQHELSDTPWRPHPLMDPSSDCLAHMDAADPKIVRALIEAYRAAADVEYSGTSDTHDDHDPTIPVRGCAGCHTIVLRAAIEQVEALG